MALNVPGGDGGDTYWRSRGDCLHRESPWCQGNSLVPEGVTGVQRGSRSEGEARPNLPEAHSTREGIMKAGMTHQGGTYN